MSEVLDKLTDQELMRLVLVIGAGDAVCCDKNARFRAFVTADRAMQNALWDYAYEAWGCRGERESDKNWSERRARFFAYLASYVVERHQRVGLVKRRGDAMEAAGVLRPNHHHGEAGAVIKTIALMSRPGGWPLREVLLEAYACGLFRAEGAVTALESMDELIAKRRVLNLQLLPFPDGFMVKPNPHKQHPSFHDLTVLVDGNEFRVRFE